MIKETWTDEKRDKKEARMWQLSSHSVMRDAKRNNPGNIEHVV